METLYKIRLEIDGLIQLNKNRTLDFTCWEIHKSLLLSKAWSNKTIKLLNPEENSLDAMIKREFSPQDDLIYASLSNIEYYVQLSNEWDRKSILEKIDFLIQEIDKIINNLPVYSYWKSEIESTMDFIQMTTKVELPDWSLERDQVYIHLTEAKMFLGFELLNMKENGII